MTSESARPVGLPDLAPVVASRPRPLLLATVLAATGPGTLPR
ncbi:hypothetical protein [Streptomyces hainanensis]|nr:hypothetical protein [Streptomyces hainanensis]